MTDYDWDLFRNDMSESLTTRLSSQDGTLCEQVQHLKTNVIKSELPDYM